ncbi:four-carbon acid sugar kinase family protein [Oharaeibacter diazotrophicus]|uniref:Uncharacterized protein YgbK (DUF1537 family) n=3 Tax=Oharaeibacter diazotrophicus TaxID=1920512 RepID=A0A4R6R6L3_9HYPH|nr:four-carbon acid sugar kinase family protein [Oharaeibacter diazotrophicus]TDP81177.1 uncharacterized protein YgbK (DUF1537 family) [Oharaeibacter diazotrophicus]BBE74829.1 hypothetical protein OHA_2_00031 [Pleomorphomonas sp. SM30]GLS75667.1 membrane protein [Oharaeibacter diazotrophicus]
MTVRVAIVADDLTGALDTAAPFVSAGLAAAVAVTPAALDEAIGTGARVVAVATASRALPERLAAERAARVAARLAGFDVVVKKIDSRLKGNVGAEAAAVAEATGRRLLVVAPAVPDQSRFTVDGRVTGRGVALPLPIAPLFAGRAVAAVIHDARDDGDLDHVAATTDWSHAVAVGARGLGAALARRLGVADLVARAPFAPAGDTLFAFGSRDPITTAQIDRLVATGLVGRPVDAPHGRFAPDALPALPAVLRCTGAIDDDPAAVAERFGAGVATLVRRLRPAMLATGGGDTALAVLAALGVGVVSPRGEVEDGVPWFTVTTNDGVALACSVKSGGFGSPETLLRLLPLGSAAGVTS